MVGALKGGVGKTTTAIHLAAALNRIRPTILVDMDEQNPGSLVWAESGNLPFDVLDPDAGEARAATHDGHIVWDAPAAGDKDRLVRAFQVADLVVLPTTPEPLALRSLAELVSLLNGSTVNYKVLLTVVPPWPSPRGDEAREAITSDGVPIFATSIRRAVAFQDAVLAGGLVFDQARGEAAWQDYMDVAKEALTHE